MLFVWFVQNVSTLCFYQTVIEIIITSINLTLCAYCTVQMFNLHSISRNLRIILVFEMVLTAYATSLHTIEYFTPHDAYSFAAGHTFRAFFFYGCLTLSSFAAQMFNVKYLVVAIERRIAYQQRHSYDNCNFLAVFLIIASGVYLCVATYNIATMLYMVKAFPQLQNKISKDLKFLNINRVSVVSIPDAVKDTNVYFKQLQEMWKIP
ncbi:unnamed protein product [Bursaphelenchus okinawaensis]|uniref:G_PROTEIN_RECEP_F1_2 domain-containing protein n=1 Tax=Bursaphelenchus okinawaensis TaxID=465554 RepID=A0A811KTR7_9BILA|nr:unnamed protein product [Bursaphelenchus okinawaensis]CAG9113115.1 unnamed protein product [Bursaphelenchus okinawaensis]